MCAEVDVNKHKQTIKHQMLCVNMFSLITDIKFITANIANTNIHYEFQPTADINECIPKTNDHQLT